MPGNRKPMRYAHAEGHTDLCYSEDGAYILTCGIDGDVRIWLGLEDDDPKSQCVGEKALAVAHKDEHMYVGTDNNYVQSYTFPEPERDGISVHFTAPVTHISTCKTSSKIVCGSCDMQIQVYDTDTSQSFYLSGHMAPILGVALDPKEKFVVSSSCDGSVRVWSLENRGPVKTWHCLQKYNSFYAAKCLGRVAWQPGAALYLAVPEGLQVTVYHRDNWNVAMVFTEKRVQKPFSITAFSPCGDFLAASTIAGDICIWDVKLQCCVSFSVHDNGHSICALAWNPSGNGEIAYCDSIGQLGTVEECISKESSHVQKSEDGAIGDLYTSNVYDDDDEDGDHVISLNKIKADASQLAPRATTLLGLDLNDHSSLKAVDDDAASSVSTGIHTAEKITIQPPFQPTSTPTHLQHRFMVWNSVGIVRCYNTEDENSLDVEFHDTSLHHALHMNNYLKHSMASLSDQALVLACAADSDISSKLVCVLLSAWDGTREWSVDLPDGEEILAVATSAHWIAAATDTRNLRLFTLGGTQREIVSLSGPVVCLTGHKEWLLVVYHNGSGLSFTCLCVKDSSVEVCSPFQTLPLTPKCTLQWLGFSDEGTACTMDSSGMIRILSPRGYWVPLCDTRAQCKSKSDHYFVLGVSERYQNIRCVLCKCSHYPPTTPRPTVAEISTQLPLCETSSEKSGLEGKFLLAKMHCTALEAMSGTDHSYEEDKERAERTIKETVIKMFALACRSGLEHRALDLCQLMPSHQVVQLAVKYASKIGKMHLADRLLEVVANKMKEEEALALHKISSQDQFLQERNVWDNVNESTVSSTDVAQDNCLVGESDPFANTPDSESTENDNLLVDAKKREKSLLESGKTSGSQKRINPFKRNLKRTESGKGLENLISSFVQSHNSSSKTVGLKLTPQTEIITKIKQTSLCEKSLTSNKGNITFVQWFAQEKSSLQMEFPEMDVSELTRQGMKRYKELALTEKQNSDGVEPKNHSGSETKKRKLEEKEKSTQNLKAKKVVTSASKLANFIFKKV